MGDVKYTQLSADPDESHAKTLRFAQAGSRVLEVGAATGYMTAALQSRGCEVVALEPEAEAVAVARAAGIDVKHGFLHDLKHEIGTFDLVLLVDVIEHVFDPRPLLRDCLDVLRPDGSIVVSVPNVAHWSLRWKLLAGRFDYEPRGLLDDTHVRFYTVRTLEQLFRSLGLDIIQRDATLATHLYPAAPRAINHLVNLTWYRLKLLRWLAARRPSLFAYQNVWQLKRDHSRPS